MSVQRSLEMIGIPTVNITVEPEETRQARSPRALCPVPKAASGLEFSVGRTLGRPNDPALHRAILRDALSLLTGAAEPGRIETREYP